MDLQSVSKVDWSLFGIAAPAHRCRECGGQPVCAVAPYDERKTFPNGDHFHVYCESGRCKVNVFADTAESAVSRWNTAQERVDA